MKFEQQTVRGVRSPRPVRPSRIGASRLRPKEVRTRIPRAATLAPSSRRDHNRLMRFLVGLAILACLIGCEKKTYHFTDVPYCKVASGVAGSSFNRNLRLLHVGGDEMGVAHISGMRPKWSVMWNDSYIVAVVACADAKPLIDTVDLKRVGAELRARQLPLICNGQRVVVKPTLIEAVASEQPGFHGSLPFPRIDPKELTCRAGTLAYGDAD